MGRLLLLRTVGREANHGIKGLAMVELLGCILSLALPSAVFAVHLAFWIEGVWGGNGMEG
jgi:hypothetical protein